MFAKLLSSRALSLGGSFARRFSAAQKPPVRVAVTGAAGNIGYALVFRIASGEMLGKDQPVILHLLDLPHAQNSLKGVAMELNDCAFPLLQGIVTTDNEGVGFKDIDYALLVGAKPRGPGMERADLLKDNGKIFVNTGRALNDNAKRTARVLVVGNPANTNCLICSSNAPGIPRENFAAMTMLDHTRALHQLAHKTNSAVTDIQKFVVWGNHSPTMYPDINNATIKDRKATELVDNEWVNNFFIPTVQKRGAAIIEARKLSSAASAANAAIQHMRLWSLGSSDWTSFSVHSKGNTYGVDQNLIFSFPVTIANGKWTVINGLNFTAEGQQRIKKTEQELLEERKAVENLLQ
eukprot:TRINITY_DN571_c0_g1_i1.p1 TRINITY_DN571_c0_g1~~TRINITY_DN571_c0_g1_i1.p1  ORF type:complete len:350 (+),score=120.93 TRINITY_DN571_c0_g1_i1:132-1181(+)